MHEPWKIESQETAFENRWWNITKDVVRLPDGAIYEYFINHGPDGVIVVPVGPDGRFFVQQMYKHGARSAVLEFPMGRIDGDETPADAAARELKEETGLAGTLEPLGSRWVFPSSSASTFHVFLARDVRKVAEPEDNPKEVGEAQWVTAAELRALLRDGKLASLVQDGVAYRALDVIGV
ncbi:MAG: NUDIX hydrolase [Patescibacteria group bacterium]